MKINLPSLLVIALTPTLAACGMVSNAVTSDDAYLTKAETATGIPKANLTLVSDSKEASLDAVNFSVKDSEGNLYRCYFTTAIAVTSDAICTKINADGTAEPANQGNCNALLKAAGKC